jgi:hypothetical protein
MRAGTSSIYITVKPENEALFAVKFKFNPTKFRNTFINMDSSAQHQTFLIFLNSKYFSANPANLSALYNYLFFEVEYRLCKH